MKILFSAETMYPPLGGADISLITLLNKLGEKHDVRAVYIGEKFGAKFRILPQKIKKYKGNWINAFINYWKWKKLVVKLIREERPDLILTQELFTPATVEAAKKEGVRVAAFVRNNNFASVHGYEFSTPETDKGFWNKMNWKYRIQYPFFLILRKKYQEALRNSEVFSVSEYIKSQLERINVKSKIIRPFIDTSKYKSKKTGKKILYIGPSKAKGMDIFFKIVEKMPEREFIVIGNLPKGIKKYKNLEIISWTDNMKKIYEKTGLLLVPSRYPDPCPRVVIEAGISGIPSIVSNRGGLPEEVSAEQVVEDMESPEQWVEKIKMLDNTKTYRRLSKKALKISRSFDFKNQYKLFLEYSGIS